jgi:RNA polymerase sigma factor (sigma-70 family)
MHEFSTAPGPTPTPTGEESWVEALYRAHAPALFAFLRRRVAAHADAEDLLVEVFTAALEHPALADLDGGRQAAWLWRVARNKAVDHQRRAARRPTHDLDRADELRVVGDDAGESPEGDILRRDEYRRLHAHLDRLTPVQRDILRLRFADGLHSGEIARVLGRKDSSVRMLLMRAVRSLRALYAQQEGHTGHTAQTGRDHQEGGDSR